MKKAIETCRAVLSSFTRKKDQESIDKLQKNRLSRRAFFVGAAALAAVAASNPLTNALAADPAAPVDIGITFSQIATADIPAPITSFWVSGYYNAGDGGHQLIYEVLTQPTYAGAPPPDVNGRFWDRASQDLNIRQFGAQPSLADNRQSIQNCIDYADWCSAEFKVTRGTFNISAPLIADGRFNCIGHGRGSTIKGNFADYVIKESAHTCCPYGPKTVERLGIVNTATGGSGMWFQQSIGYDIEKVFFDCRGVALRFGPNVFTSAVRSSIFNGGVAAAGSVGLMLGGHASARDCDIARWHTGARIFHTKASVGDSRIEVCNYGVVVGRNELDQPWPTVAVDVSNNKFEGNLVAIWARKAEGGTFNGNQCHGSNSDRGQSQVFFLGQDVIACEIAGNVGKNTYSTAVFQATAIWTNCIVEANYAQNGLAPNVKWSSGGFDHTGVGQSVFQANNF